MVFLNVHRGLATGTVPRLELAWLYSITEHVVAYKWRTMSRRREFEVPVSTDDLALLATTAPGDDEADVSGLVGALSELPAMERRALLLREWQGFSYREVAADLGVSNRVVERLLRRGRRRLAAHRQSWRRDGRIAGFALPWPALKSLFSTGVVAKGLLGAASVVLIATAVPALRSRPAAPPPVAKVAAKPQRATPVALPTRSRPYAPVVVSPTKHLRHAAHKAARPSSGLLMPSAPAPVIAPDDITTTPSPPADPTVTTPEERSVADVSAPITAAQDTLEPDGGPPPADPGNSGNHWGWANSGGNGPKDPDPNTSGQ
jgi:DNA-directed RNA polymerase specialized sigma24 family protein